MNDRKTKTFLKGISKDEFPENRVGRRSNRSFRMRTMTVSEGFPTHSPRRVIPYFYRYFDGIVSKTTRIEKDIFSYMA